MQTHTPVTHGDTAPYDARPWLTQYPADVPPSIELPTQSIWEALEDTARRYPNHTAFVFQSYTMTFAQLRDHAERMSAGLARAGVRRGDVVLCILPNIPHFPVVYFAAVRLGAAIAAAPANSAEPEFEHFMRDTGARVLVTLDLLYEKVSATWRNTDVQSVVVGSVTDFMPARVKLALRLAERAPSWVPKAAEIAAKVPKPQQPVAYGDGVRRVLEFMAPAGAPPSPAHVEPDDVAVLQYTGGTTGLPKAAMLTHGSLLANARQMMRWFPSLTVGEETIMAVLPFSHVYGLTLVMNAGLLLAARTVLIAGGWQPAEIFEAIGRYRPSVFPGVPTLYVAIINDERSRRYDLHSIKVCVSGGAPLPMEVKRDFEALTGGHLYEGYGLSEASPLTHAQPYTGVDRPGSMGLPVCNTDARIVDDNGQAVPLGESGEMIVRGPQVMKGYWRRPEETQAVLRDGWLYTGDVARMDQDGYFYIVDRKKDLIITGGENIYPREIEEVLFEHPKVKEAAVVGVPHPFGGEIAKAFIVLAPGETSTKKEIQQFCAERLAKHKVPRAVEFRDELPKSQANKVLRRVLAEEERQRQQARGRHGRSERAGDEAASS